VAIDVLRAEVAGFAALLTPESYSFPVPGCPGWTVIDLARHLGGIHRWARVALDGKPGAEPAGPDDEVAVAHWYRTGAEELISALIARGPDAPCWTFGEPHTTRFWMRRQAQETTLHRWDLQCALGADAHIDNAVAVDGIAEVAEMFLPRQVRLGRMSAQPTAVELRTDCGERFVLRTADNVATATAVHGPAEALLLLVWKRIPLDDSRLSITGDGEAADAFFAASLTP
jgi:uncharacterized protein (TIGR03083 family)